MSIEYRESAEGVTPAQLTGFFVGWPNPPAPERHVELLRRSAEVVLAVDAGSGRIVGFITAISDGVLFAYIPLLEVLPEWQGRGIGGELVRRMLRRLAGLYAVDLLCDAPVQAFYERLGMKRGVGMLKREYAAQAGRRAGSGA